MAKLEVGVAVVVMTHSTYVADDAVSVLSMPIN